jgi:twinkle protein
MTKTQSRESAGFVKHIPCVSCGSRDNNALYRDGSTYCFGCQVSTKGPDDAAEPVRSRKVAKGCITEGLEIRPLLSRKITQETCAHFGYSLYTTSDSKTLQVAPYYDVDGNLVAQKLRGVDKTFSVRGDISKALPFGAHCWQKTGKKLVVTEGEIDALSMSQVQGNKWPVVSIPGGAQSAKKHFAECRDYYLGFDEVVLMFDSDEPGRKAAKEAAEVLGASRARIAELPLKDANEMLLAGKTAELIDAMWKAKEYRPEGIVDMASLKEAVKKEPTKGLSWWSPTLTSLTYGIRTGEIYAFGAGTGVGKTDFLTQQMAHLVLEHKKAVGVFSLEQHVVETAKRIAGKAAQKTFHIPESGWTEADLDTAWTRITKAGKVFLYDSFGANEWESVKEKIEYLKHAHGVQYVFLDHLTALAAAEEDERVALERIMADMGSLVKRLDIALILVSHLATPEHGSHEEGARVTIRQFKGSRAIGFWCHFMFGLERDQQSEDDSTRTTTTFRVLKDRYTGRATGATFALGYDRDTGMLFEKSAVSATESGFTSEAEGTPSDF